MATTTPIDLLVQKKDTQSLPQQNRAPATMQIAQRTNGPFSPNPRGDLE